MPRPVRPVSERTLRKRIVDALAKRSHQKRTRMTNDEVARQLYRHERRTGQRVPVYGRSWHDVLLALGRELGVVQEWECALTRLLKKGEG